HVGALGHRTHLHRVVAALGRQRQRRVKDALAPLALGGRAELGAVGDGQRGGGTCSAWWHRIPSGNKPTKHLPKAPGRRQVKHVLILMMDFTPTETQQAVADLTIQILADAKPDPWKELAQAGLLGLGVLETAALLTEIGRRAVHLPALPTLMTGALPITRWGSADLQHQLLPPVAAGEQLPTAAIREPSTPFPA